MTLQTLLDEHFAKFRFVVIGHRGAAGLAPENTLAGFKTALTYGVPMIELDVHRVRSNTKADTLFVIHDDDVRRTTNGRGRVSRLLAEDLVKLDAGNGEPIPSLSAVIELIEQHNANSLHTTGLNIELKGPDTAALVAKCTNGIANLPILVSSFDHAELNLFHQLAPTTAVAPLFDRYTGKFFEIASGIHAQTVNWSRRIVSSRRVALAREKGLRVFVYTVNEVGEARDLQAMGVNGIFTDRPDRMLDWLPQA